MFPIPSSKPAAGSMATGSISALPTLCKTPNIFLNIKSLPFIIHFFSKTDAKKGMSNTV
jgi:hypothetical protein